MIYDTAIILAHELNRNKSLSNETRERTNLGIDLFKEGRVKTLLMSGNWQEKYGISLAKAMKRYAIGQGIIETYILEEEISSETAGQLIFCKQGIIDPRGFKAILIVSHDYHIPRVRTISDLVFSDKYNIGFEEVKADSDLKGEAIEKEKASEALFLKTFASITPGDDNVLLERLLKKHERYNRNPEKYRTMLEKLIHENLS